MAVMVRLEWRRYVHGFDVVERPEGYGDRWPGLELLKTCGSLEAAMKGPKLWLEARRPNSFETYVLDGTHNRVFAELANVPPTPEGAQAFVNKWGLLYYEVGPWQLVDSVHAYATTINERIDRAAKQGSVDLKADLILQHGKLAGDVRPSFFLNARSLPVFCDAEFAQLHGSGIDIKRCLKCGAVLVLGTVGQPAIYCSSACRVAMHRQRKKERERRVQRRHR